MYTYPLQLVRIAGGGVIQWVLPRERDKEERGIIFSENGGGETFWVKMG